MSAKNEKRNNLYTRTIPSLMMLSAGAVAFFISLRNGYSTGKLLLVVLVVMFVFAILGTVVKSVVDSFNMHQNYEDFLEIEEGAESEGGDVGEIVRK